MRGRCCDSIRVFVLRHPNIVGGLLSAICTLGALAL